MPPLNRPFQAKYFVIGLLLFVFAALMAGCSKAPVESQTAQAQPPPQVQPQRDEEEFEANHEERRDWFLRQRMYPFDQLPTDARRRAWESRPAGADMPDAAGWSSIGPRPTQAAFANWGIASGRINAIAVSPANAQIVLAGGATGGIWRSIDGGANFSATSDNQVDLAVGSIAFAPSNASIVYAGMGDRAGNYLGTGVLRSTDAGQTWTRVSNNTLPAPGSIVRILVSPTDANRVYVAQWNQRIGGNVFTSGFFYSTDGGINWTKTLGGLPTDLARDVAQPDTLYLGMALVEGEVPTTGGVWRSINGGQSWTRVYLAPSASTSNVKVAPYTGGGAYVLVAGSAGVRIENSPTGNFPWTNLGANFDTGQIGYNCYLFAHPTTPSTVYVGTRDVWRSVNGGANFTNLTLTFNLAGGYTPATGKSHPDQHFMYISPSNPNDIYIANDGGLWRTTDAGNSFQSQNQTLGLTMFTSLAIHPTQNRTYGGTQDNGTQRVTSGQNWQEFIGGDGGQVVVDGLDPSIVYTTYVFRTIYRWTNNGDNYNGQIGSDAVFMSDRTAFYPPFVGNGVNPNLYFGTYRLWISTNRGLNWNPPAGALDLTNGGGDLLSAINVSRLNQNIIYVGSAEGRVQVSSNAGLNWTPAQTGLPTRFITSINSSPADQNTAYLTVSGYGSGHVFKTINLGGQWTDISSNLPDVPVNTLVVDLRPGQGNTLYVGTDIGVFRSTDGGASWQTFNNGMPPVIVTEMEALANGNMKAATYGRGAYEINLNVQSNPPADFDGDGKTDISVYRASNNGWYVQRSSDNVLTAVAFGAAGDIITPGDYNGDGLADHAVFRPSTGIWYMLSPTFNAVAFGQNGDIPAAGDYDGDGKWDVAVFRPSTGTFYVMRSTAGFYAVQFGISTDRPVVGDYDGDRKADVAVFRPSSGTWYMLQSTAGFAAQNFGLGTDNPSQGDYDGDGKTDVAVFRPSNGTWYLNNSQAGFAAIQFGNSQDSPAPGDYDGDGKTDVAVFRAPLGSWYILRSQAGFYGQQFGTNGDQPVPAGYIPQ